ncbi:MAG: hypothetical protein R2710_04340 [Acidimicrobiales bacterium]
MAFTGGNAGLLASIGAGLIGVGLVVLYAVAAHRRCGSTPELSLREPAKALPCADDRSWSSHNVRLQFAAIESAPTWSDEASMNSNIEPSIDLS